MGDQQTMAWARHIPEERVEGIVEHVIHGRDAAGIAWRVISVRMGSKSEIWTGESGPLQPEDRLVAYGRWETSRRYNRQEFRTRAIVPEVPQNEQALERFLVGAKLPGVGLQTARRILKKFGAETVRVLAVEPHRLLEVPKFPKDSLGKVIEIIQERSLELILTAELASYGAQGAVARRIIERYGDRSLVQVRSDPYRLSYEVAGIGFRIADAIAEKHNVDRHGIPRTQAAIMSVLDSASESHGHVYVHAAKVVRMATDLLNGSMVDFPFHEAIKELASDRKIARQWNEHEGSDRVLMLGLYSLVHKESRLALMLASFAEEVPVDQQLVQGAIVEAERKSGIRLSDEQRGAVYLVARSRLAVLTGGPGTGKSSIQKIVLAVFRKLKLRIAFAAPTGRAAKRLRDATGELAQTVHKLLGADHTTGGLLHDDRDPLPFDVVICDEASMLDLPLAFSLVRATKSGARLVFVGDVDQLPPVGPGAILRDLIESGAVPTARLSRVYRQASGSQIVSVAASINAGERLDVTDDLAAEVCWVRCKSDEEVQQRLLNIVSVELPEMFDIDPVHDVQVMTPSHDGTAGTKALNTALQERLNPWHGDGYQPSSFRVGDKVMVTENDYTLDVYNGDVGTVAQVKPSKDVALVVRFEDDRKVEFSLKQASSVVLAYACTIHKAQGGEVRVAVIALPDRATIMLSRQLIYTGLTRGKERVVLVASERAVNIAIGRTKQADRFTMLAERLRVAVTRAKSDAPPRLSDNQPEPATPGEQSI